MLLKVSCWLFYYDIMYQLEYFLFVIFPLDSNYILFIDLFIHVFIHFI